MGSLSCFSIRANTQSTQLPVRSGRLDLKRRAVWSLQSDGFTNPDSSGVTATEPNRTAAAKAEYSVEQRRGGRIASA